MDYIDPYKVELSPNLTDIDKTELKEIHYVLSLAFKDLITVCDHNNLDYFVTGGTLLGALRHEDWIPWDDDIDIAMEKKDIKKLINIYKNDYYLNKKYNIKIKKKGWKGFKLFPKNYPKYFIDVFELQHRNNNLCIWNNCTHTKINKKHIYPLNKRAVFDNMNVIIPNNSDAVLKKWLYKSKTYNPSKLPPIEYRIPHHLK